MRNALSFIVLLYLFFTWGAKAATKAGGAEHLLNCLHNAQTVVEKLKKKSMYSTSFCVRTN